MRQSSVLTLWGRKNTFQWRPRASIRGMSVSWSVGRTWVFAEHALVEDRVRLVAMQIF